MIKIGVFEDHPIVLNSLVQLINEQSNFELLFAAKTKIQLFEELLAQKETEIMIVDLLSQDIHGMEVFEYLSKNHPGIKVIAFTTLSSPILVENFLSLGVKAYVNKNQEPEDLINAIKEVDAGKIYLPKDYDFLGKNYAASRLNILSDREVEIIQLISREFTSQDIAEQLEITVNTVENHRKKIFAKLNVKNVAGMVREAAKQGYI